IYVALPKSDTDSIESSIDVGKNIPAKGIDCVLFPVEGDEGFFRQVGVGKKLGDVELAVCGNCAYIFVLDSGITGAKRATDSEIAVMEDELDVGVGGC